MKHGLKILLLASVATAVAPMAAAQSSSTEARLQALEAMVAQLKSELAAEKAQTDSELILLERKATAPAKTAVASASGKGFLVGNTTVNVGGHIDLDVNFTKTSSGPISSNGTDFYLPSQTPVGPDSDDDDIRTDFTAKSSRLKIGTSTPTDGGNLSTLVEMDFLLGPGGNELVSNSYNPRLRRAYVDYKGWRVGQEWSTFQGLHAIPESASFYQGGDSQVFVRQPMIRYTNGNFQFAAENPNTRVYGGPSIGDDGVFPDLIARYNMKGDWGIVSISAMARNLTYKTAMIDESAFGLAASIAGKVKVGSDDDIRFTLQGGEGLGRYIGLGMVRAAEYDSVTGAFDPVSTISGNAVYRHVMGDMSANFGVSFLDVDIDNTGPAAGQTTKSESAYVAVLKKVAPKLTVGGEFMVGNREITSGQDGSLQRVTFSVKQGF